MKTMTAMEKKRGVLKFFSLLLLTTALLFQVPLSAMADTEYIATWKEYQASGAPAASWNDVADAMTLVLEAGKEMFAAGDLDGAYKSVSAAYYGYYETTGFERVAMGYIGGGRKSEMELQFSAAKAVAKKSGSAEDFNAEVDQLISMLRQDANVLDGTSGDSSEEENAEVDTTDTETLKTLIRQVMQEENAASSSRSAAAATFFACFGIILREGFEAILIVGAIIAYLAKSAGEDKEKKKKYLRPVYIGSLLGIAGSFVLAWLLYALRLANSAQQEIIEGVTALTAVAVLYYVSNWMLSKSETDAWTAYIKGQTAKSTESGSTWALAVTAFLAVFREGAEVVLFFQPLLSDENISMVWAGFGVGCVCLVFVYLAIHFLSLRIPIKPFFIATSVLMFIMSISFLGGGIKELIEGDVLMMTSPAWLSWIPTNDLLDVLGIYPCLETLVPQLLLMIITVIIFVRQTRKNRAIHAEAEARRAEERAAAEAAEKKAQDEALRSTIREVLQEVLAEREAAKG